MFLYCPSKGMPAWVPGITFPWGWDTAGPSTLFRNFPFRCRALLPTSRAAPAGQEESRPAPGDFELSGRLPSSPTTICAIGSIGLSAAMAGEYRLLLANARQLVLVCGHGEQYLLREGMARLDVLRDASLVVGL